MSKRCKLCNRGIRCEGHPYCIKCFNNFTDYEKKGVINKVKNSRSEYCNNKNLEVFF